MYDFGATWLTGSMAWGVFLLNLLSEVGLTTLSTMIPIGSVDLFGVGSGRSQARAVSLVSLASYSFRSRCSALATAVSTAFWRKTACANMSSPFVIWVGSSPSNKESV
jgi:hypothetical protein